MKMRAILIDPVGQKINVTSCDDEASILRLIEVDDANNFDCVHIDAGILLMFNAKPTSKKGFYFLGNEENVTKGKALLIGIRGAKLTSLKENLRNVKMITEWTK